MNKIKINEGPELEVTALPAEMKIADNLLSWDLRKQADGTYHILANGKSYNAILEEIDRNTKTLKLRINGNSYELAVQEPIDQLLKKMGLNIAKSNKVESIKAPMPGRVLKIMVTEGQEIKKGEPVLILEAMKMENVFKAPADAVVKSIKATERTAVEKGQVLIELA